MIDINKLNKMLDDALALESVESLNLWMEEQIKADREAGIIRNAEFGILHSMEMETSLTASQEAAIEIGITGYISYYISTIIPEEFEINSDNDYNLAA